MAASQKEKGGTSSAFRQLISYALFGCVCSAADVAVFWCLTSFFGLEPLVANVISVACGLTLSFYFNRRYTFKVSDNPGRRYVMFIGIGLCGMCVQELVIAALTTCEGFSSLLAKLCALVSAGLLQFALNRTITFRSSSE
ncbi:MAG: GtrA family protein [Tractidigestivibacter sp.]|jgi:putative flippase GtrA|uniref:GtrA family protein n=1 Tax=Tractidigestivibacter sp. TaxID=2847320 RepID=UPI003D8B245B